MVDAFRSWFGRLLRQSPRGEQWDFVVPAAPAPRRLPLSVAVHPRRSAAVVAMLPGWNATIDGYCGKYAAIAGLLQSRGLAVVRTGNAEVAGCDFAEVCRARARALIEGALRHARGVCGRDSPRLQVFGISAGAGALAAVAHEYPAVTGMLLVAPAVDAGQKEVLAGMRAFTGRVHVVAAANDEIVGGFPQEVFDQAARARCRELRVVPDCDHQFRGARNGRVLSQAPLWAFLRDEPFPDPVRGIHLYD